LCREVDAPSLAVRAFRGSGVHEVPVFRSSGVEFRSSEVLKLGTKELRNPNCGTGTSERRNPELRNSGTSEPCELRNLGTIAIEPYSDGR
jgi:hypothetical protein